ncbi:hypothetical protein EYF80_045661 [Liparis tanakae]|uniref:Uncharacterized protein n=1 Tax=Liparis tanakae TaxID=230148 RepID=A0A4Z2FUY8_9TELE|nr:hypothetical protein EYF80_045661 [Liparis tanakae]
MSAVGSGPRESSPVDDIISQRGRLMDPSPFCACGFDEVSSEALQSVVMSTSALGEASQLCGDKRHSMNTQVYRVRGPVVTQSYPDTE